MDMHENAVWQCQSTEDEERILRQKSYFFIMPGDGCHAMECHPEGKAALLLTGAWRLSFFLNKNRFEIYCIFFVFSLH